jgi:hypothetical protein
MAAAVEVDELLETLDEDLLDDHNADGLSVGSEDRNTDGADNSGGMLQTLSAPNANDFPNARLIEELEGRRIRPTGANDQYCFLLYYIILLQACVVMDP